MNEVWKRESKNYNSTVVYVYNLVIALVCVRVYHGTVDNRENAVLETVILRECSHGLRRFYVHRDFRKATLVALFKKLVYLVHKLCSIAISLSGIRSYVTVLEVLLELRY